MKSNLWIPVASRRYACRIPGGPCSIGNYDKETTNDTVSAQPPPPASRCISECTRMFSKDRSAVDCGMQIALIRIFVADQQPSLVPYMQIPIARRIDYPRPDRDRARSRDARAHRNPGQMRDSWLPRCGLASIYALAISDCTLLTVSLHRGCLRYNVPIVKINGDRFVKC